MPKPARAAADAADARARAGIRSVRSTARSSASRTCSTSRASRRARDRRCSPTRQPATATRRSVRRLRAAGAVIVAKTNMTEFAFSGVGMNPHYGTPGNPADRARVPGGSSVGRARSPSPTACARSRSAPTPAARLPHPGGALRRRRLQAEQVSRADRGRVSALLHARLDRAARAHGRGLRRGRRRDGGRGAVGARARAARGLRLGIAQGLPLRDSTRPSPRASPARARALGVAGVRLTDETVTAARRHGGGQCQGRLRAAGSLAIHRERLQRARSGRRSQCARCASSAASSISAARLCRHARGARGSCAPWTRGSPISTRSSCRRRRSSRRRWPRSRRRRPSSPQERRSAAQHLAHRISSTSARSRCRCRGSAGCPSG